MILRIIVLVITLSSANAFAYVYGGSNLSLTGYPEHSCFKPNKPYKPISFSNQWDVDSYNSQVDHYNMQWNQYISCINEYVDNAKNDIKRVTEKAQEAIDETQYRN